jgi:hypothetical protein
MQIDVGSSSFPEEMSVLLHMRCCTLATAEEESYVLGHSFHTHSSVQFRKTNLTGMFSFKNNKTVSLALKHELLTL